MPGLEIIRALAVRPPGVRVGTMSTPEITQPVTFPARLAWLQREMKHRVRPYHVVFGAAMGLITVGFAVLVVALLLIATNFNLLSWIE
jgi:hypothetical protein